MGEHVLEGYQPQHGLLGHLVRQTVGDAVEGNHSFSLLDLGSLVSWGVLRKHRLENFIFNTLVFPQNYRYLYLRPHQFALILNDGHNLRHGLLQILVLVPFPLDILVVIVQGVSGSLLTPSASDIGGDWKTKIVFKRFLNSTKSIILV